jgi:ribosomal protein S18 acetylase RimI-like enzyme
MELSDYPKTIRLGESIELQIRPLLKSDQKALHRYFLRLPAEEVSRLKNDVTDPKVVETWIYDLDYDATLPLVALNGGHIVGVVTLHFNTIGWTKHQGEIRFTVDPEYREIGVSTALIQNIIEIARSMGLEQLTAEIAPTLNEAYFLCEKMGFKDAAVLKNFIKDKENNYEDMVLMIKDINGTDPLSKVQ